MSSDIPHLKSHFLAEFCLYTSDTKPCISSQLPQHLGTIQTGQNKGDIPAGWAAPLILQPYYSVILSGRKQLVKAPNPSVQEKLGPGAGLGAVLHPGLPNRMQGRGLTWRFPAPPKGKISSSVPAASPFYAGTKERGCSPTCTLTPENVRLAITCPLPRTIGINSFC